MTTQMHRTDHNDEIRVFIVEDNQLLLQNLTILLNGESDIVVAGSATCAETAIPEIRRTLPRVVLVDIGLPGKSGIDLIRSISESHPDIELLAHTVLDTRDTVFGAIRAGASGYLLKGSTPREIVEALHDIASGGGPMSPKIARSVIREFHERTADNAYVLTARETQILKGLEAGFTYNELADDLSISPHTVHTHVKSIYDKLHAKSRREALTAARRKGII